MEGWQSLTECRPLLAVRANKPRGFESHPFLHRHVERQSVESTVTDTGLTEGEGWHVCEVSPTY